MSSTSNVDFTSTDSDAITNLIAIRYGYYYSCSVCKLERDIFEAKLQYAPSGKVASALNTLTTSYETA